MSESHTFFSLIFTLRPHEKLNKVCSQKKSFVGFVVLWKLIVTYLDFSLQGNTNQAYFMSEKS